MPAFSRALTASTLLTPSIPSTDASRLPLAGLVSACHVEKQAFLAGEPAGGAYGYELFRRAICLGDEAARAAVMAEYRELALVWIRQQRTLAAFQEDEAFWLDRAFQRLWFALRPEQFHRFQNLKALLSYLKLCVYSAIVDEVRARGGLPGEPSGSPPTPFNSSAAGATVDTRTPREPSQREYWDAVRGQLRDETERRLVELAFGLGLKSSEIHERHPDRYTTKEAVCRLKLDILDRLRRHPELLPEAPPLDGLR